MDDPDRQVTGARPAYEAKCPAEAKSLPKTSVRIRDAVLTPTAKTKITYARALVEPPHGEREITVWGAPAEGQSRPQSGTDFHRLLH